MNVDTDIAVPALVAGFVTLAVEYTAKPRLEARKERILERHRDFRELRKALAALSVTMGTLKHDGTWIHGYAPTEAERANRQVERLRDLMANLGLALPPEIRQLLSMVIGLTLAQIILIERTVRALEDAGAMEALGEMASAHREGLEHMAEAFHVTADYVMLWRARHWLARRHLRKRAVGLYDDLSQPGAGAGPLA